MIWPKTFDTDFQDAVKVLRPIELAVTVTDRGESLSGGLSAPNRKLYQTFIQFELEKNLAKIIGATWKASAQSISRGGASGMPGGMPGGLSGLPSGGSGGGPSLESGMPSVGGLSGGVAGKPNPDDRAIVLWKGDNQQEIVSTHFSFIADTDAPTTLQVLYAQEDLWVLQNILRIVKNANGDATARHEAAIKVIDSISIGRSAQGLNGKVTSLGGEVGSGGAGSLLGAGGGPGAPGGMPGGMPGGPPGAGGPSAPGGAPGGMPSGPVGPSGPGGGLTGAGAGQSLQAPTLLTIVMSIVTMNPC